MKVVTILILILLIPSAIFPSETIRGCIVISDTPIPCVLIRYGGQLYLLTATADLVFLVSLNSLVCTPDYCSKLSDVVFILRDAKSK